MEVQCEIRDKELPCPAPGGKKCKLVEVAFIDNGIGMDSTIIKEGLLKIAASSNSRSDAGRKANLTESAGGFGLAKHLG